MSPPKGSSEARSPLTREAILLAAIELADVDGLDSLTMRALGDKLGVEAMSLYNHVENKDDLLDGMVDIVLGRIALPPEGEDWKAAMRSRAVSAREVLAQHTWATLLIDARRDAGPRRLRYFDSMIGSLRRAGFPVATAAHALSVIDSYIYGFALQQIGLPSEGDVSAVADDLMRAFTPEEYPHLAEMLTEYGMSPDYDYDAQFEYGLDVILEGLEQALES